MQLFGKTPSEMVQPLWTVDSSSYEVLIVLQSFRSARRLSVFRKSLQTEVLRKAFSAVVLLMSLWPFGSPNRK